MTHSDTGPLKPVDATADLPASAADAATLENYEATDTGVLREGPGTKIGPYKLLQLIGEGGFGSVFMAEQERPVSRKVALKIIKMGMDTRQVVARFEQERQALAILDHANIAKVFDAGATETGRPYFVMELCTGEPIDAYCDKNNLSIHERLELFAQVCAAVQHAHTKGIIHRDLKPGNVLVSAQDGRPGAKVIDFGIAKATSARLTERTLFTEHRQIIGTPEYMSPEQAEGSLDIDTRADVYALGVMLYELLTGTTPFSGRELRSAAYGEIQRIIREVEPPRPSTRLGQNTDTLAGIAARRKTEPRRLGAVIRGELDWIVMKAMEKDRQRRYETASGLMMDIRRYLDGEAVEAAPPSAAYRFRKFVRRNRVMVAAGGAVAAALVLGVVGTTSGLVWALQERDRASAESAKARLAAEAEARATVVAKENERRALAESERAVAVSEFVTTALRAGDAQSEGGGGDMTILAAMENAIKDIESGRFKNDPETEASLKSTIATILLNNSRLADAETLAKEALETRRRIYPGDHRDVAQSLNKLAMVRFELGRVAEAETLFGESLAMSRRLFKGDHADIAKTMDNLARVWQSQRRLAEAQAQMVQAMEMRRRLYEGDHADLATGLNNLALLEEDLGRLTEAEGHYLEAIDMWKRLHGRDHPDIATGLHNLAHVRMSLGRAAEAEPLLVEALAMSQRLYKGDHLDIASGLNALGSALRVQNRGAEAETLHVQALAMYRRLYQGDHRDIAASLSNLASAMQTQGKTIEAEPLFREALAMYRRLFTGDHPEVANAFLNLARAQQLMGERARAREGFDACVSMNRRLSPEGSARLARALWRSGSARLEDNDPAALGELREAVRMAEAFLPAGSPLLREYRETLVKAESGMVEQPAPAGKAPGG